MLLVLGYVPVFVVLQFRQRPSAILVVIDGGKGFIREEGGEGEGLVVLANRVKLK